MTPREMPDHPVIRSMEYTGYPDGRSGDYPLCPVCGDEAMEFYKNDVTGEIVGCDRCISRRDAEEGDL